MFSLQGRRHPLASEVAIQKTLTYWKIVKSLYVGLPENLDRLDCSHITLATLPLLQSVPKRIALLEFIENEFMCYFRTNLDQLN